MKGVVKKTMATVKNLRKLGILIARKSENFHLKI
jgi:hypothetical protein